MGDFGTFEGGQFVSRGNVSSRIGQLDVIQSPVNAFDYASSGRVTIAPLAAVPNPAGGNLLKAKLSFTKSAAVVASFQGGVESRVSDADTFGQALMELWHGKKLNKDRVVVWLLRRADGRRPVTRVLHRRRSARLPLAANPTGSCYEYQS